MKKVKFLMHVSLKEGKRIKNKHLKFVPIQKK